MQPKKKICILGAGPSGLSVSWELARRKDCEVTILEADSEVGGLSKTLEHEGIRFDIGPHRLSPQLPGIVEAVRGLLGDDLLKKENFHGVFIKGKLYCYPPKAGDFFNLASFAHTIRYGSSWTWARFADVTGRLFTRRRDEAFDDILLRYFGRVFCDEVIFPMIHKVWGTNDLHSDFARIRFELPTFTAMIGRIFSGGLSKHDNVFYYPAKGFGQIWNTLEEHLAGKGHLIEKEARIEKIEAESLDGPFKVSYSRGGVTKTLEADTLVSTISNKWLLEYLSVDGAQAMPTVAPGDFPSRTLRLGVFMVRNFRLHSRVIIVPESKYIFNRISEMNQFHDLGYPKGQAVLLVDVICDHGSELDTMYEAAFTSRLLDSFLELGWCKREDVCRSFSVRLPNAYPVLSKARYEAQEAIERYFSNSAVILCGREASSDYNNAHNAIGKGFLAARYIAGELGYDEFKGSSRAIGRLPIQD